MGIWQLRLDAIADESKPMTALNRRLGMGRMKSWRPGFVAKEWLVEPSFCTADGTPAQALFGGYIGVLADQVMSWVVMSVLEDDHYFRTSNLQLNFFRVIPAGLVKIEGRIVNRSSRIIHSAADFYREDGLLAANATAIQVLVPMSAGVREAVESSQ